jgi:uncharacterized membrane protein YeaQ/YmgE (transglycosylase-associated protein family)
MSRKTVIMIAMVIGSCLAGYLVSLFGFGVFSFTSLIASAIGGSLGIYVAFKLT